MRIVPAVRRLVGRWSGSDPGHVRLFTSTATVVTTLVVVVAEYIFVTITHALLLNVPAHNRQLIASTLSVNHDLTVVALLLGALVVFVSSLSLDEKSRRGVVVALLYPPLPLIATIAFGLGVSHIRWLVLLGMSIFLGVGTLGRRIGSRGAGLGLLGYVGAFFGYFLSSILTVHALGWLACEILLALVITALMRTTIFFRSPQQTFRAMLKGFEIRARVVATSALHVLGEPSLGNTQRLQRNIVALNESGLMVESALGAVEGSVGGSADVIRQSLFDLELSLSNIARFIARLERLGMSDQVTAELSSLLNDIAASDDRTLQLDLSPLLARFRRVDPTLSQRASMTLRRLANSLDHYQGALNRLRGEIALPDSPNDQTFHSPIVLRGGFLPGSSEVSAQVSTLPERSSVLNLGLRSEIRAAIQVTLASALAIVVGDAIDPQRFYWAPLAALLCFMGANTSAEQIVKGLNRVVGTVLGIVVGYAIATGLDPHGITAVAIMLISLFVGLYLLRVSYLFTAFGVTVALSLLYAVLSELTAQLLVVRLEETIVGAVSAIVVALVVLPLSSRRVFDFAVVRFVEDGSDLIAALANSLGTSDLDRDLVDLARRVDLDFQTVRTVGRSMRGFGLGTHLESSERFLGRTYALRNYLRTLSEDVRRLEIRHLVMPESMRLGLKQLLQSFSLVVNALKGEYGAPYERSAHLFEATRDELEAVDRNDMANPVDEHPTLMILSDLIMIDGALAALADLAKVEFRGALPEPVVTDPPQ